MDTPRLTPGKKYKHPDWSTSWVLCLGVGVQGKLVGQTNGGHFLNDMSEPNWIEYKEPTVHKTYVIWWKRFGGDIVKTFSGVPYIVGYGAEESHKVVQCDELTYTES